MNSRLLNLSTILVAVVTVGVGVFIYNSAQSVVPDALDTITIQEVEAFNNQFTSYEGIQTGSNVRALMGRLIANADTYADEPAKIPAVVIDKVKSGGGAANAVVATAGETQTYIDTCGSIRNKVETKHEYYVEINYQKNGLLDVITITYDSTKPANTVHRGNISVSGGDTQQNDG